MRNVFKSQSDNHCYSPLLTAQNNSIKQKNYLTIGITLLYFLCSCCKVRSFTLNRSTPFDFKDITVGFSHKQKIRMNLALCNEERLNLRELVDDNLGNRRPQNVTKICSFIYILQWLADALKFNLKNISNDRERSGARRKLSSPRALPP